MGIPPPPGPFALIVMLALAACSLEPTDRPLSDAETAALPGELHFTSERDGPRGAYRLAFGGAPERLSDGHDEVALAVSPDGRAVVVGRTVETPAGLREQLAIREDGELRLLTPPRGRARNPSWSPDGRWLVFESDLDGFSDVYRVARDGSGLTRLTDAPEGNFEPAVSPSGAEIVFASSRDQQAEVYRMAADGADPVRVPASPRDEWRPRWAPDGSAVAVLSNERGRDELYVMRPDGSARQRLNASRADGGTLEVLEGEPAWAPDASALAYTTRSRDGGTRVWTIDLATGTHRALTAPEAASTGPAWSPDGRWIAFVSERDGDPELYVMRADGARETRLTRAPGPDSGLLWAP